MQGKSMKAAELVNGRAAMIGCSALGLFSITAKSNLIETMLSQNVHSLWVLLGVYAG
tara:strand:+ start:471 stop:641 length:171 start_codon:yes stop_codon:yes gene_type:complete